MLQQEIFYSLTKKNKMKSLSSQEKKILGLIGRGLSSPRIAEVLQISPHTVESHRKSLLVKFDVKNSAQLISKAILLNVLTVRHLDNDINWDTDSYETE
jgi:DNA-binding CsgD family transcriptional regulator